jgi:predicted PurR-regulated permease PerM
MTVIPTEKIKQVYFLMALTALTCMLAYMMRDFFSSFLGATTMYILFRHPLHYLMEQKKWPRWLVVILLMLASMVIIALPVTLVSLMLSSKAAYMVRHYGEFIQMIKGWNVTLSQRFHVDLLSDETLGKVTSAGANVIPSILSTTFNSLLQLIVIYFLLYFMMMDGRQMERWILDNSPFNDDSTKLLSHELKIQTMSNSIGIPVLIVIQAAIAGFGYWIFGLHEPFFWGVITGFASMIPIVGVAVVWIPLSIYMYADGHHGNSIGMAIYSGVTLVNVEHLVRFALLKKLGNTHPLVTFFGIIIGISLFGFLGLIFGPLIISYFMILLGIYKREYLAKEIAQNQPPSIIIDPSAGEPQQIISKPE